MAGRWIRNSIIYLLLLVAVIVLFTTLFPSSGKSESVPLTLLLERAKRGDIKAIEQQGDTLVATPRDEAGPKMKASFNGSTKDLYDLLKERGVPVEGSQAVNISVKEGSRFNWGALLTTFLPLLFFGFLLFFMLQRAQGANSQAMNFGRSRARLVTANRPNVTFADVAGVDEAKAELQEVVEFLKHPEKFQALGARVPKGVLLVGPPGTGKTLLARAVAGEAKVPFFSISGSEFVEMFVGVGASRVRDLFDQAKRSAPCIVFVDEIDAVGRHRGAGLGGSHDEREQTLNQILVEMDGFDTNTQVIVLSASNRPDILDPALLRPGRFDRQVVLDRPDIAGRKAILEVHARGKPLEDSVNLEVMARLTSGFSGADLANLVNEGAILAARRNKSRIGSKEMEDAIDRIIAGPERKSRVISQKEKEMAAFHEAGHALVAKTLPNADPVHKISIVARGLMGGYTRQLPTEDRHLYTRSQFNDMLAVLLGGRAAEEQAFNEMTTGSENDIERATKIARMMVTEYGMSLHLGPRTYGHKEELVFLGREISEQRNYGDKVADKIDEEVNGFIDAAHHTAQDILTKRRAKLEQIARRLIEVETIEGEELNKLLSEPAPESVETSAPSLQPAPAT